MRRLCRIIRDLLPLMLMLLAAATAGATDSPWDNGIIAYWSFEDGACGCAGTSIDGDIHGASPVGGVDGSGLQFDGLDDYVVWCDCDALNPADGITVSAWYRPVSYRGRGSDPVLCKGYSSHDSPFYQYHLGVSGDQYTISDPAAFDFQISIDGLRHRVTTGGGFWTAGSWYHLAGVYDGSAVMLYVNGALADSLPASGTIDDYGSDLHMGKYANLDFYLPGTIDEVAIYGRGLSTHEIGRLYALSPPDFLRTEPVLEQNFPNPFNPVTSIPLALPAEMSVALGVYSIDGRLVSELERGTMGPGRHLVAWNGTDVGGERLSSGVYFVRLEAGDDVISRKVVLLR